MESLDILCKLCGHEFRWHQMSTYGVWFCDYEDSCECTNFYPMRLTIGGENAFKNN